MVTVDYHFYSGTYGGDKVPETVFQQFAYRAGILLKHMIRTGEQMVNQEKIQWLICELCDRLYDEDRRSGIHHESLDGYDITYSEENMDGDILQIVRRYLGDDGVLYRGRRP